MADSEPDDADERRHRKGLKFRRRDDYAVELFREAQANLEDLQRVNRILLELGRFYNPYINAPIVDLATRRRIIELLERSGVAIHASACRNVVSDSGPDRGPMLVCVPRLRVCVRASRCARGRPPRQAAGS